MGGRDGKAVSLYGQMQCLNSDRDVHFAFGVVTPPDQDESFPTGLTNVVDAGAFVQGLPSLGGHMWVRAVADGAVAGNIRIFSYIPTADDDAAWTASVTEVPVSWYAFGAIRVEG